MKLFALTGVFFVVLILGGCTISQQSGKMTDEQIFEKKQECAGYSNEMIKEAQDYYNKPDTNDINIVEIFYSPVKNTCYYITSVIPNGYDNQAIALFDFFSKKYINSYVTASAFEQFNTEVRQLKGE